MQSSSSLHLGIPRAPLRPLGLILITSLLLLAVALPLSAAPAAWGLDPTFGDGGRVITDIGPSEIGSGTVIQSDGRIVVVGTVQSDADSFTNDDFLVIRYNPNGTLDTSFDGDGMAIIDFFGGDDGASSVILQEDGRIVVAGYAGPEGGGVSDFAVARFNTDGSLDTSFSGDGKVLTDFGHRADGIWDIVIQPDQKIVAVGVTRNPPNTAPTSQGVMARYNSDGGLDTDFGEKGRVVVNFGADVNEARSVALQSGEKIVIGGLVGGYRPSPAIDLFLARYQGNGTLDDTFGEGGATTTDFDGRGEFIAELLVQEDGRIVAVGSATMFTSGSPSSVMLARYDSNGELDPTFDGDGKVLTAPPEGESVNVSSAIIHDGGYLVSGNASANNGSGSGPSMALAQRYLADGSLDANFGSGGRLVTDFGEGYLASALDLAQQGDKIVVVGVRSIQGNEGRFETDVALARFHTDAPPPPPPPTPPPPPSEQNLWLPLVLRE